MNNYVFLSDEEKVQAFDRIAEHYYNHNFGTLSKMMMDTLMFQLYKEQVAKSNITMSDFAIGRELGLTVARVQNLKYKCELLFPDKRISWKVYLKNKLTTSEAVHCADGLIKIPVDEKIYFDEIKDYLLSNNYFIDTKAGSMVLEMKQEYIFNLCSEIFTAEENEEMKTKLEEYIKVSGNNVQGKDIFDKIQQVVSTTKDAAETISIIVGLFSPLSGVGRLLKNIFK